MGATWAKGKKGVAPFCKTPIVYKAIGEAGATQRLVKPNESMREVVHSQPQNTNVSRVQRPGPKPMFDRRPITPLANKVGPSTTAQTQKIPLVKALLIKAIGEGSRGGKVIGHTKSGNAVYAPSDDAIAHMREHVNLQKKSAEGKLAEHAARHLSLTAKNYTSEEHSDAAEHHGKEAVNFNNSDKIRALHRHIAEAHKAKSSGALTPAAQAEKEANERAAKREANAKKKEASREKTTVAITGGGHEIKNTHHIRYGGFGSELKEGPKSGSKSDPRWQPVETELGAHLTHEQHKDIAGYHRGMAAQHETKSKQHYETHKKERASGSYDRNVNNLEQASYHRNAGLNHLHAAELHEKEAAVKPAQQKRQESAGQLDLKLSMPRVRRIG